MLYLLMLGLIIILAFVVGVTFFLIGVPWWIFVPGIVLAVGLLGWAFYGMALESIRQRQSRRAGTKERTNSIYLVVAWIPLVIILAMGSTVPFWAGKIHLAWIALVIAIAAGLEAAYYLLAKNRKATRHLLGTGLLALGVLWIIIGINLFGPSLSVNEVKAAFKARYPNANIASVSFVGHGVWRVKVPTPDGWYYYFVDEDTGTVSKVNPK